MQEARNVRNGIKLALTAGVLLLAGTAAFAASAVAGEAGFRRFTVGCHDGATQRVEPVGRTSRWTTYLPETRRTTVSTTRTECRSQKDWVASGQNFCEGRRNRMSGKVGLNSFSLSDRCTPFSSPFSGPFSGTSR